MQLGRRYDPLYGERSAASATRTVLFMHCRAKLSYTACRVYVQKITDGHIMQILCTERLTAERQTLWRMRASHQTSTRSCLLTGTCSRHCQNATQATLSGAFRCFVGLHS